MNEMNEDPQRDKQFEFSNGWVPFGAETLSLIHSFTPVRRFSKFWCRKGFSHAYRHRVLCPRWATKFRGTDEQERL
jgi:hypothetical protein